MNTIRDNYTGQLAAYFKMMSSIVTEQLQLVAQQLNGDKSEKLFKKILDNEKTLDKMELTVRDGVIDSIVLYSPRARDLRRAIAYYDAAIDIERIGDVTHSISKRMTYMLKNTSVYEIYKNDTLTMFDMANRSVQNAIFAFEREDKELAKSVIINDDAIDMRQKAAHKRLFTQNGENAYPNLIADLLDLDRIFYSIERIGDGATNIAESVIFLAEGKDVKHTKDFDKL